MELPAPPPSLTRCWDRAKWHFELATFPKELGRKAARAHIVAVLRFLGERGFLTAAGKRAIHDGEALLEVHVRQGARAFLDQSYDAYLARTQYGKPPPVEWLASLWNAYESRVDVTKRCKLTPLDALLTKTRGRTLGDLLWDIRSSEALLERVRAALPFVAASDRPLVEATLALNGKDPVAVAKSHHDPALALHALRYLTRKRRQDAGLKAAATLAKRLDLPPPKALAMEKVEGLAHAVNLGTSGPTGARAWKKLTKDEQRRLARTVDALYIDRSSQDLALEAMRCVADAQTLALLRRLPPAGASRTVLAEIGAMTGLRLR